MTTIKVFLCHILATSVVIYRNNLYDSQLMVYAPGNLFLLIIGY